MTVPAETNSELHPEIATALAQIEVLSREAPELLSRLDEEQLDWRPSPDRWSVGEVVLHLNAVNGQYLSAMEERIAAGAPKAESRESFRYGWFERWFVAQLEPTAKRRLKAPRVFRPKREHASRADVEEFVASLDRAARVARSLNGVDLARVKLPSPVTRLLKFSLGTCLKILTTHTDRHLRQARAVTREAQFPEGGTA